MDPRDGHDPSCPHARDPSCRDTTHDAVLAVARLARVLERASDGLGLSHYRILAMVAAGDERASRVAERLALGKPAVSAAVDALVSRGLLSRTEVAGDQRAIRLRLTAAGRATLGHAETSMAASLGEVLRSTPDPPATLQALASLDGALEQHLARRRPAGTGEDASSARPTPQSPLRPARLAPRSAR